MKTDILTTEVIDTIAVVTLGSPNKMYFDMAMGDTLTEELQAFAGDPDVRVVIITGGTPGYFNRHFDIPALIDIANKFVHRAANGRITLAIMADFSIRPWPSARPCRSRSLPQSPVPLLPALSNLLWPATSASLKTAII